MSNRSNKNHSTQKGYGGDQRTDPDRAQEADERERQPLPRHLPERKAGIRISETVPHSRKDKSRQGGEPANPPTRQLDQGTAHRRGAERRAWLQVGIRLRHPLLRLLPCDVRPAARSGEYRKLGELEIMPETPPKIRAERADQVLADHAGMGAGISGLFRERCVRVELRRAGSHQGSSAVSQFTGQLLQ